MMNYEILKALFKEYGHEKILFIGFDIGKYYHVASIWNGYKDTLLSPYTFSADESGYTMLTHVINQVIHKAKPEHIYFGCEPSGHYYLNLMNKLYEDYKEAHFRLINPRATKSQREMAMERDKTDPIDTTAILELLIQGNSYEMPVNDHVFDEIKEVVRRIDRYTKEFTALKNRIHVYLDELYPQFEKKGTSLINTKSGKQFLTILPDPKILKTMTYEELIILFKEHGYTLKSAYAKKFIERAREMLIPQKSIIKSKIDTLKELIEQYMLLDTFMIRSQLVLRSLLSHFHFTENILGLRGMGVVTLSRIIAYLNNPFRFENGSKAAQFAGLTPSKSQSGISEKREKISRMGHKALRSVMIQLAYQLISSTAYFTAFYNRLVIEKGKDINLAVTATAHKILRVIIKMMHSGEVFNPPTAKDLELANSRIHRFTKAKKMAYQKMRKAQSGTQNMLETYLTRV
ncbi:IS110 family transposase [Wukongibacter baidiensis]|uniref:IS110 family transposase n=1 Tax=Wukongibacter baidiensis TaxID=1723361 RepID=UPI003D7F883C